MLLVGFNSVLSNVSDYFLTFDGCVLSCSAQVKSFGIMLESTLSFSDHINHVSHMTFVYLGSIVRLCPLLTQASTDVLINAFVTSCFDYCTSISSGIPKKTCSSHSGYLKLCNKIYHAIQNSRTCYASVVSVALASSACVQFKILLLAFKTYLLKVTYQLCTFN